MKTNKIDVLKVILITAILLNYGCDTNGSNTQDKISTTYRLTDDGAIMVDIRDEKTGEHIFEVYNKTMSDTTLAKREIYFANETLKSRSYYRLCKLDGIYEQWGPNGNLLISCNYENGMKEGVFTGYTDDGMIRMQGSFKKDTMDGLWEHYKNGLLEQSYCMKRGKMHGYDSIWTTTGRIKEAFM